MHLNLPNYIALLRIALSPVVFWLLGASALVFFGDRQTQNLVACALFLVAAATDYIDGYLARKLNQITTLGEILDPLADKMLMLSAFLALMLIGRADGWAIFLILSREFLVTGLRVVVAAEGKNVAAGFSGKLKTVLQIIACAFLMLELPFGGTLLWASVAVTLYSGFRYAASYLQTYR